MDNLWLIVLILFIGAAIAGVAVLIFIAALKAMGIGMSIEAMKQALEYIEANAETKDEYEIAAGLRQAIAEAEKQVSYTGNGTAGRENMTAPTGFFFQMPKAEKQEPVAWHEPCAYGNVTTHKDWALANGWKPLYTHPQPKREWVGLTDEERQEVYDEAPAIEGVHFIPHGFAIAIEAKLKEKNT